jgi:hypothetical protein
VHGAGNPAILESETVHVYSGSTTTERGASSVGHPTLALSRKIRTLVSIAVSHGASISVSELFVLLPSGSFETVAELELFVRQEASLRAEMAVTNGEISLKGSEVLAHRRGEQFIRSVHYSQFAQSFSNHLTKVCPWIRLVAISGSTAYRGVQSRDDVDLFVVTGRNRLWITLLVALVGARIVRATRRGSPLLCLNRLQEERECRDDFRSPRDPLFAREALNLRVLQGSEFFQELLDSASWMRGFFPILFDGAIRSRSPCGPSVGGRLGRFWTLVNWSAFAFLAPYLAILGIWRNARMRQVGNLEAQFKTVIRPGFLAYESTKYDLLRDTYRGAF